MSDNLSVGIVTTMTVDIDISGGGTSATLHPASPVSMSNIAGLMSADDKTKSDNTLTNTGIMNATSSDNSEIIMGATGTIISRDIADANPALSVDLVNGTSTGNIQIWNTSGVLKAFVNKNGEGSFPKMRIGPGLSNPNNFLDVNAGTITGYTVLGNFSANGGFVQILNSTTVANQFAPSVTGKAAGNTAFGLGLLGYGFNSYSQAAIVLSGRNSTNNGPVTSGKVFSFRNYTTEQMSIDDQGNVTVLGRIQGTPGMGPLSLYDAAGISLTTGSFGAFLGTYTLTANQVLNFPDASGTLAVIGTTAPASASDTGAVGEIRITSTYVYFCIAIDTWVRAPFTTW